MTDFPDEELPRRLDAAEADLARSDHRWFARASLLAALATGFALLLPWTYTRRYGLSVWQLGFETQPTLALTCLAGIVTTVVALVLNPGGRTQAAAGVTALLAAGVTALIAVGATALIAITCLAIAWQATTVDTLADTWPGPGAAVAIATSVLWLLAAIAHLVALHNKPAAPEPADISRAVEHLRRTR